jgi:hypothetical protein
LEAESGRQTLPPPASTKQPAPPRPTLGAWLLRVTLLGLASPFVEVWQGGPTVRWAIGLVILFVGMQFAWKITAGRPLEVYGPFQNTPQPSR